MAERTLLQMVNSVKQKLRGGDALTSLPSGNLEVDTYVALINEAARQVLEGRDWSFMIRDDGRALFPPLFSGTALTTTNGSDAVELREMDPTGNQDSLLVNNNVVRFASTSDSIVPNTSFALASVDYSAGTPDYTLALAGAEEWWGDTVNGTANWQMFSFEHILPVTVGRVLSVRNEETPLQLSFEERYLEFDQAVPRPKDSMSSVPELAVVGGVMTTTFTDPATTGRIGVRMAVWPVPNVQTMLRYTYAYVHTALAAETDVFGGVPENIIHLIEWRAVKTAFASIEKDARQAAIAAAVEAEKLVSAIASDNRAPTRRMVPPMFGTRPTGPTNRRWASQTIDAP